MFSTVITLLTSSFLRWFLLVNPHAHLHIFISSASSSSFFFCWMVNGRIPSQIAWLVVCHLWLVNPSFAVDGILLSHSTPDIIFQLFIPDCTLLLTSTSTPPSFCITLPRHLNSLTSGSWLTGSLPASLRCSIWAQRVSFGHGYIPSSLPVFWSLCLLICSSSSSPLSQAHSTMSSTNISCHGARFVSQAVYCMASNNGQRADPWCSPTSMTKGSAVPHDPHFTTVWLWWHTSILHSSTASLGDFLISHAPVRFFRPL